VVAAVGSTAESLVSHSAKRDGWLQKSPDANRGFFIAVGMIGVYR
jgi:hypothetical protein